MAGNSTANPYREEVQAKAGYACTKFELENQKLISDAMEDKIKTLAPSELLCVAGRARRYDQIAYLEPIDAKKISGALEGDEMESVGEDDEDIEVLEDEENDEDCETSEAGEAAENTNHSKEVDEQKQVRSDQTVQTTTGVLPSLKTLQSAWKL